MENRINKMNKFWDKALKCKHENLNPNYCEFISCSTPYCNGNEVHCMDCNVYISECSCGYNNGMSGWSLKRNLAQERRKRRLVKERTLAIIKPDAVLRYLIGNIIQRIEIAGFDIIDMKMIKMSKEEAKGFYKVHAEKPFYNDLAGFMSSGRCVVMILEGRDVIARYRKLMGATNYKEADAGTIREGLATSLRHNVVHGSDSKKSADFEINYFFGSNK